MKYLIIYQQGVVGCAIGRDFYQDTSSYNEITNRAKKAISLIKQMAN
ncbi:MAG: hypothetical protein L6V95_00495 [Candidatus Melainabacteria bacterium]|nr:MAG: hypothetical protein L6V95_00495 [Candidatus Melainabacteria bacterium]